MTCRAAFCIALLVVVAPLCSPAQTSTRQRLGLRFLDSATGFAVQPEITILSANGTAQRIQVSSTGRVILNIAPGDYTLSLSAENYLPMTAAISPNDSTSELRFALDPIKRPSEILPEKIKSLHQAKATIFVGFVADDDSGQPAAGVRVFSSPSGRNTQTDTRGFFQIVVPLQSDAEWAASPAKLIFRKEGFGTQTRQNLELSAFGDTTLLVRMKRGSTNEIIDEQGRRISPTSTPLAARVEDSVGVQAVEPVAATAISPTNSTIRLPTNIRVLLADNITVEYVSMETYVRRSLNDEWIASWGNSDKPGGTNSLKAGAVAIRSYAAWHVRNPRGTNYDICATTSCQVYDTDTATVTDTAASQTAGYVVISAGAISRSEYSAENNSIGAAVTGTPCGDGYTEPSTTGPVCVFDPACSGEVRFGHGRGMCQWGTARWSTGWKMAGRVSGDSTPNGFPKQDWVWLVNHYYPTLTLVQAMPLVVGDDIKAVSTSNVRQCAGGGIESGVNCLAIASKSAGATGIITGGPVQVTSDGGGYTWWQIQWSDGVVGWSVENYLERVVPLPAAPGSLTATAVATNQINLSWADNTDFENGFQIQRAFSLTGPWVQIAKVGTGVSSFSDTNVTAGNSFFYRVRAFNVTGNSGFSNTANASTPGITPVLPLISNKTVAEETLLTFTNSGTASDVLQIFANFEGFETETSTGTVLFRSPRTSTSTSTNIEIVPDYSSVTTIIPSGTEIGSKALFVSCNFTNTTNPWLRLTTAGAANIPNPVIDFSKPFQFRIYSDKAIRIGLGLRETTTATGTIIGSDGGTTGSSIEWVGVTNKNGAAPIPTRTIPAGVWTNIIFNLPSEPAVSFSSGNGILSTASGLGVLEHLAIVPLAGNGIYKMYFDNFTVVRPKILSYTLDAGFPAGATINSSNGVFAWTPTEAQGPGNYNITARVTDNGSPALSATRTFSVAVSEINLPPVLATVSNRAVHAGNTLTFTNFATDPDIPTNTLTFSLLTPPTGASINPTNGVFSWTPTDGQIGSNPLEARVTDNGSPILTDTKTFAVTVVARPFLGSATVTNGSIEFSWNSIVGQNYRVQFKNTLEEQQWTDLQMVVAGSDPAFFSEPIGNTQRYYRLVAE